MEFIITEQIKLKFITLNKMRKRDEFDNLIIIGKRGKDQKIPVIKRLTKDTPKSRPIIELVRL